MSRLAIFGCGGMAREVADMCIRAGLTDLAFIVDGGGGTLMGFPVLEPQGLRADDRLCIALGDGRARRSVAERFPSQPIASVVARSAIVAGSAVMAEGAVVCEHAVVNNGARIGRHFLANVFAQLSHDCVVGDFVTLSPHVSCNGWVEIEDDVFVGAGAVIRNGSASRRLRIGKSATIGMGAVVLGDVPAGATVVGNPARVRRS